MVHEKLSAAEDSEDGSVKSGDMEVDTRSPSRPSSPPDTEQSDSIDSSPSDLSCPMSLSSKHDPTSLPSNYRSKVIPRTSVQGNNQCIGLGSPGISFSSIPRTVPCIVLSPNEMYTPPLYTNSLSPDSIMSKMSRLSNSFQGSFRVIDSRRPDAESCCASGEPRGRIQSIQLHDSLKQIIEANQIVGESTKLFLNCDAADERKSSPKDTVSKQLSFGMDRILGNDKGCTSTKDEDESKSEYAVTGGFLDNKANEHQHQHPNYIGHCSECFLLSRFSYKLPISSQQRPVSANYSSWVPSQHLYDNPALLSPSGYSHQHPVLSSFGLNASNFSSMSSMVSCNTGGSGRRKRSWSRAVFSNLQRKGLEKRFQIQKYITKPDRRQLAATLGLTDPQVKVWFQNRRMKWRHTTEGKARSDESTSNVNSSSSSNTTKSVTGFRK